MHGGRRARGSEVEFGGAEGAHHVPVRNCWLEALAELRAAIGSGDADVWSSFWEFLIRHGYGKDSDSLRAAPFDEQRTLLLRVVDAVEAGTIVFHP